MQETTGYRLILLREELDYSQEQVAKLINTNKSTISRYESDKTDPRKDLAVRLAKLFNTSVDYIFCVSDVRHPCGSVDFESDLTESQKRILQYSMHLNEEFNARLEERALVLYEELLKRRKNKRIN